MVLAGHRTTDFLPLEHLAPNDTMVLEWVERSRDSGAQPRRRSRHYRVAELRVVEPADTAALQPTLDERLTLITCYPFGRSPRSPQRYVVQAVRS